MPPQEDLYGERDVVVVGAVVVRLLRLLLGVVSAAAAQARAGDEGAAETTRPALENAWLN